MFATHDSVKPKRLDNEMRQFVRLDQAGIFDLISASAAALYSALPC